MLEEITHNILSIQKYPTKVGISGIDGSGKTRFARQLADYLVKKTQRQVIIASIDGFHNPREKRYHQGRTSARGYYDDSFNCNALVEKLLKPLSENGDRLYSTQIFDVQSDAPVNQKPQQATSDAILILEGIFLFRPETLPFLDYKIWIDVPFSTALDRMLLRDINGFKSEPELKQLFNERYKPGQEIYFNEVHPKTIADVVINNTDFDHPHLS